MSGHPASVLVHWPSGPVAACDKHAAELVNLGQFLGSHIAVTTLLEDAVCVNCENEASAKVSA